MNISNVPVPGAQEVVCGALANHCNLPGCHAFFDEGDDICANGHRIGQSYFITPDPQPTDPAPSWESRRMVCGQDGNRCTICHAFFGEGDDICANGHRIGQEYDC